jgi:uncharacterized membrane protein HdeD (DUF308 family)
MDFILARNWWSLAIRGIVGIAVGIVSFLWPGVTLAALVIFFGAYALIDGIVNLTGAVRAAEAHERWGVLLLEGMVGILAAVASVLWPAITALAFVYIIGAWAILTGVFEIGAAIRIRKYVTGEWLLAIAGVLSILFGVLILAVPLAGALVITLWFGAYAFLFGVVLLSLGLRLRRWRHGLPGFHPIPVQSH